VEEALLLTLIVVLAVTVSQHLGRLIAYCGGVFKDIAAVFEGGLELIGRFLAP